MVTRLIDIVLSIIGIIIVLPFFPFIALFIKLDSKGPVFYLGDRVGKDMRIFKMYKFRTMLETPVQIGESISPQYDPRVTPFGRILRRTKINELPQLINILKGEMAFVGPRPETPDLAELYPEAAKEVFSIKPGLVGPSQIIGRNEEELYPPGVDVKKYYIEKIVPGKVELDLKYKRTAGIFKYFMYILLGIKITITGVLSQKYIKHNRSQAYLLFADVLLIIASFVIAHGIERNDMPQGSAWASLFTGLLAVLSIRVPCFLFAGLYNSLIRYISYHDIFRILKGATYGSLALVMVSLFLDGFLVYSKLVAFIDLCCLVLLLSGLRFALKIYWERSHLAKDVEKTNRILIFGAGDTGALAYRALVSENGCPFEVVGFVDDAPEKHGKMLHGLKVLGDRYHIQALARLYKVGEIVFATSKLSPEELRKVIDICTSAGLSYRMFWSVKDLYPPGKVSFPIRSLDLSDILSLNKITMDSDVVRPMVSGKTILVTGSGGAMDVELCRQILQLGCKRLIVIDQYESYLTELVAELLDSTSREVVVPVLYTADNMYPMEEAFWKYRPDIVFHTSMKKYLPFLKVGNGNIAHSNYERTFKLARLAADHGCRIFLMISSVAAGNGSDFITDSLRLAELSVRQFFKHTSTRLVVARVCDIVENRGGIISVIDHLVRRQGDLSLLPANTQIYLTSKCSAAQFILQSLVEAKKTGYEGIFVCDTGPPVALIDLVRILSSLHGIKVRPDDPVQADDVPEHEAMPQQINLSRMLPTGHPYIRYIEDEHLLGSDSLKAALDSLFFRSKKAYLSNNYWERQSRKLMSLCKDPHSMTQPMQLAVHRR